jgi:hypothetical protein
MLRGRRNNLMVLMMLACLGLSSEARASFINEPNNSPASAAPLPVGQLLVVDDLNGNVARPDPMLAVSNFRFQTFGPVNDDTAGVGDGHGSQILGVPLDSQGNAYFRVTGHGDNSFTGAHSQDGSYEAIFRIYDPTDPFNPAKIHIFTKIEDLSHGAIDNLWVNASMGGMPNWRVDVTINNLPYPRTGDAVDFFYFEGLAANKPYSVKVLQSAFSPLLGIFDDSYHLLSSINGNGALNGVADQFGRALIGVTGQGDNSFMGAHTDVGQYTVEITPEPSSAVLLGVGAAVAAWFSRRRGRRRK